MPGISGWSAISTDIKTSIITLQMFSLRDLQMCNLEWYVRWNDGTLTIKVRINREKKEIRSCKFA